MIDFLESSRQAMIDKLQMSLKAIRNIMGFSAQELGEFIGVTRQTINNLETGKSKMNPMQYVSLSAVIDNYVSTHEEILSAMETIIATNGNKQNKDNISSFHNSSLLKRWFTCFGDFNDIGFSVGENAYVANRSTLLNNLISSYKVFIAADSLMSEGIDSFMSALGDSLSVAKAKIIVPLRVVEQVQQSLTVIETSSQAFKALKIMNDLQRRGVAELRGESGDTNPQDTIVSVFAKFRSMHRLCLITQDESFASEITRLNISPEKQGFDILAGYVDADGQFRLHRHSEAQNGTTNTSTSIESENFDEGLATTQDASLNNGRTVEISLEGWKQL